MVSSSWTNEMLACRQHRDSVCSDIRVGTELAKLPISSTIWLIERHLEPLLWLTWGVKRAKGEEQHRTGMSIMPTKGLFSIRLCHYTCEVIILLHSTDGVTSPSKSTVFSSETNLTKYVKASQNYLGFGFLFLNTQSRNVAISLTAVSEIIAPQQQS